MNLFTQAAALAIDINGQTDRIATRASQVFEADNAGFFNSG